MNIMYMGKQADMNIGNGKTVSAVGDTITDWLADDSKTIYSNIALKDVPYSPFTPDNTSEVLDTTGALVILDELHAIVHKNHKIGERCNKHGDSVGLCYRLSEFFRQVRKRGIVTRSTCQTFQDAHYQFRGLMQKQIVCEKYRLVETRLKKCNLDACDDTHRHYIKQQLFQNFNFVKELPLFDPEPYYQYYNSYEIVDGWVSYE
jgi:hypothetical protein